MTTLSKRGFQNVDTYIRHLPVSLTDLVDDSTYIDLSFAENYIIRKEILEVFRDAATTQVVEKDFNWPHGFWGEARLLTAISSLFNTYFAPFEHVDNKNIVLTAGAAGSLDSLAWSLCDTGEGMLIPCPYHAGAYEVFLNIHTGIVPVPVPVTSIDDVFGTGMIPTLEKGLRESPVPIKAIVITNPHNPLGRCYSKENLVSLIQFCHRNNLHLISDEVFALSEHGCSDLQKPRKFTSALAIDVVALGCDPAKIHVIWSVSKDLGATGARLGCVITRSKEVRDSIALVAHISVSNFSILFGRALLTSPKLHEIIQANSSRLAVAYSRITTFFAENDIEYSPCEVTTFVLAKLAPGVKSREDEKNAVAFYQEAGILFFSAADYHMPAGFEGFMRVSFAVEPERMDVALKRLKVAYQKYLARSKLT